MTSRPVPELRVRARRSLTIVAVALMCIGCSGPARESQATSDAAATLSAGTSISSARASETPTLPATFAPTAAQTPTPTLQPPAPTAAPTSKPTPRPIRTGDLWNWSGSGPAMIDVAVTSWTYAEMSWSCAMPGTFAISPFMSSTSLQGSLAINLSDSTSPKIGPVTISANGGCDWLLAMWGVR
jgi:hypothetical protein